MAVNIPKTSSASSAAKAAAAQSAPQATATPAWGSAGFGLSNPVGFTGTGGECFDKLYAFCAERAKLLNERPGAAEKFHVVKMMKAQSGLNYSAVIVAEQAADRVAAHILMVERTGDYPSKVVENINGVRYEIARVPADALDDICVSAAQECVAVALGLSNPSAVIVADGTLVPNEFDVAAEHYLAAVFRNATDAAHTEIMLRSGAYQGVNLAEFMRSNPNGKFYVNLYFNHERVPYVDQTGMPIRQDVCVALTFKLPSSGNNRSIHQTDGTIEIVKTYGYIDFEFVQPRPMAGAIMQTEKFVPNFIITHMETNGVLTPDVQMLGIASVLSLNEELNWLQVFRGTSARKGEIDYQDIGALNIEGNIEQSPTGYGALYKTKEKNFSVAELSQFARTLVHPNMMISIDVPRAAPETWHTSVFQYIKNRGSAPAYMRVVDAIRTLTNGVDLNGQAMFLDVSNKIHGGFYRKSDGSFDDIRMLSSYLSVANYVAATGQSPVALTDYTNSLYNAILPSELRMGGRKLLIDEMSKGTAVYKQHYDRLTFSAGFLKYMLEGLRSVGFSPVFGNMTGVGDMFVSRSNVDFSAALLGQDMRLMGQNTVFGNTYVPGFARQF